MSYSLKKENEHLSTCYMIIAIMISWEKLLQTALYNLCNNNSFNSHC